MVPAQKGTRLAVPCHAGMRPYEQITFRRSVGVVIRHLLPREEAVLEIELAFRCSKTC
jgi:hypothetical protein